MAVPERDGLETPVTVTEDAPDVSQRSTDEPPEAITNGDSEADTPGAPAAVELVVPVEPVEPVELDDPTVTDADADELP